MLWDVAGVYRPIVVYCPHENPRENSGTTEPAAAPVVPHFPQFPISRGHNSQKHRNRAGTTDRSPVGMEEVIFGNVTVTEVRRGGALGRGYYRKGCFRTPLSPGRRKGRSAPLRNPYLIQYSPLSTPKLTEMLRLVYRMRNPKKHLPTGGVS